MPNERFDESAATGWWVRWMGVHSMSSLGLELRSMLNGVFKGTWACELLGSRCLVMSERRSRGGASLERGKG